MEKFKKRCYGASFTLQSNEVRALVPGLCKGNCYDCANYERDTNVCQRASLQIDFPMFDEVKPLVRRGDVF